MTNTIQTLRNAFTNHAGEYAPWTFGVLPLLPSETTLFFKKPDGSPTTLELGSTTLAQIDELRHACRQATFGHSQTHALDETYMKAGKLDSPRFLWGFNPDSRCFAEKIALRLFSCRTLEQGFRFELYNLNFYGMNAILLLETELKIEIPLAGEGSLFNAHRDVSGDQHMLGSLVIVLPFTHEGGTLFLRHDRGREFNFDPPALLQGASVPSVAYAVFLNDVEHAVYPVVSGNRITISYNIYYDKERSIPVPTFQSSIDGHSEHPFKTALRAFLKDKPARLANPFLGFGLSQAYPIKSAIKKPKELELKGLDAILIRILKELNVNFKFYLLYCESPYDGECPFRLLSREIVEGNQDIEGSIFYDMADSSFLVWDRDELYEDEDCASEWYYKYRNQPARFDTMPLEWISEPSDESFDKTPVIQAYSSTPTIGYVYHQLCVVVDVQVPKVKNTGKKNRR